MIRNIRCLLALPAILLTAAPTVHAQSLTVSCTDPAGPNFPGGYESTCIASGGVAPYTSAIVNGQLPAGLFTQVLFPPGAGSITILGTVTALSPYAYTVQFTDSQNQTASQIFTGSTTNPACPAAGALPTIGQSLLFGSSGGLNTVHFSTQMGCPATLTADIPGITITISGPLGFTEAASVFAVPNPDSTPHVGNLILKENGIVVETFPITVNSSSCTYTVTPPSIHIGSGGGSGTYTVASSPSGCVPILHPTITWAQIGSTSPGMYSYFVPPDFGLSRSAALAHDSSLGPVSPSAAILNLTQDGGEGHGSFVVDCLLNGIPRVSAAFPAVCYTPGGTAPYTWSLSDGRAGAIEGFGDNANFVTVSTLSAGPYHFTVRVTDSSPTPQIATYTLDGTMLPSLLQNTCTPVLGPSQVGSGFGIACPSGGGTPPYTWSISAGALPAGLTLSAVPGGGATISGIPLAVGDYSFTIQQADSTTPLAQTTSQTFTGTISRSGTFPSTIFVLCTPSSFRIEIGAPMPPNLCSAGGGTPPYSWSIHSGSLPAGLVLGPSSASSTMVSGIPTTTSYMPHYLKVTDSSPIPQSMIWSPIYTIATQLGISCPPDGPSFLGQSYYAICTSAGGIPSSTWSISAGALPPGITLLNGLVSGTPTTPGPYNYTVSVADGLTPTPATASQTFTGVITPLPAPLDTTKVSGSMAHLAIGDGWSTTTVLVNAGTSYAQAQVNFFADDGSPLSLPPTGLNEWFTTTPATTQTMPPHATFVIDSAPPTSAPLQEGSANLSTDGDVNGFIRFRYAPRDQEAIVPLETRKAGAYLLAFDNTNGIATGVALANLTTGAATIPVVIRDNTGAQLSSSTVQLSGKSHTAFVLSDRFTNVANLSGTVEFDTPSGGQISVLGIRFPPGQRFTTIPVVANTDPGGGSLAHLAVGDGWTTTVELINFGATSAQTHLKFFADDGTPLALPLTFAATSATTSQVDQSMPPHSRLVIQSNALDTDPLATGSAQLTSDGSVSGFIRFRYAPRDQEAIVPLESRNAASYILSFDNTNGLVAGVAVANLSPTTAAVIPVIIRDSTGAQLGSSAVTLAPNAHTSFVLSGLFNSTVNQTGTVEFDAPEASPISVLGFRFPASGAFSTIPVLAP